MKQLVAVIAVLALGLAACGGSGGVVATVDGEEITLANVEEYAPPGGGSIPRDQFTDLLYNTIIEQIVVDAAAERGVTFTEAEVDARYQELQDQLTAQSGQEWDAILEQQGLSAEGARRIAHQILVRDALEASLVADADVLTEEDIREAFDGQLHDRTEACVSHILLETEEEADAALERLGAGEDFAELAAELSVDPSVENNGGDLGCSSLGGYVPEFAQAAMDAEIGEVSDPVRSQFGYHLILVTERTIPEYEDVRDEILAGLEQLRGPTLLRDWLIERIAEANVEVEAEYGTWTAQPTPQILPPQG